MLRKIAIIFLPLIMVLCIEILDDWITWKTINLYYRKDLTKAKIIKNPFYHLIESENVIDRDGLLDFPYLYEYSYSNGFPHIVYEFVGAEGEKHIDSLKYELYHGDVGDNGETSFDILKYLKVNFAERLVGEPINSTFDVYYYDDVHIPRDVFMDLKKELGEIKIYFHNAGVKLLFLSLVFCIAIGVAQFNKRDQ